jgi:PadR family transcriptional regulator, regulatory protein PadR
MARKSSRTRGEAGCSSEMGNIYRFIEPIVLLSIVRQKEAYGYNIAQEAEGLAVTDGGLDTGVIYRTLHRLEQKGRVISSWDTSGIGPARKIYVLTEPGWTYLREWSGVLKSLVKSLSDLRASCEAVLKTRPR